MPTTLRTRLWWSYALIIAAALAVVSGILLFYIIRNPSTYRQASARLTVVAALMRKREADWSSLPDVPLQAYFRELDQFFGTRVLLYSHTRQLIADSRSDQESPIRMPALPRLHSASVLRDSTSKSWLYVLQRLEHGQWLMIMVPRPAVPLLTILTDELILPVFGGGGVALIISLLAAYWLARWVGDPLQQIVAASHALPSGELKPLPARGPREVQLLSQAFDNMNRRVQASQRSQRDFVTNVSHELKTPLTSVQGFAQAILDGTAGTPASQKQAAQVIYEEAARMHRMVLDLLDLARLDAGTLELEYSPVELAALLKHVAEKVLPQARAAGVSIQVEADELPVIIGDGDRLAQVFTNLVDNAIKFTPAGGALTLRAASIPEGLRIEVEDTGSGIPQAALPYIFDRFYQADPSRPGGKQHGAGLGLAIVKEIINAHGGKITVRSRAGSGSTFTVILPLAGPEASTIASQHHH